MSALRIGRALSRAMVGIGRRYPASTREEEQGEGHEGQAKDIGGRGGTRGGIQHPGGSGAAVGERANTLEYGRYGGIVGNGEVHGID